jgi:osmotically-inducible protein OsmY
MNKAIWISPLLAIALLTAGCTEKTRTTESTGEYLDDTAMTTKVKTALATDPGLKTLVDTSVRTDRGVVTLSGTVDSPELKQRAAQVAANVPGVQAVRNNLAIK